MYAPIKKIFFVHLDSYYIVYYYAPSMIDKLSLITYDYTRGSQTSIKHLPFL